MATILFIHNIPLPRINSRVIAPLTHALENHGHQVRPLLAHTLSPAWGDPAGPRVLDPAGQPISGDLCFARIVAQPQYRLILHTLERAGIPVINRPHATNLAADKTLSTLTLQAKGLPVVPTIHYNTHTTSAQVEQLTRVETPLILKPNHGMQGQGVELISTLQELTRKQAALPMEQNLLLQPQRKDVLTGGDLRLLVVGDKVVAAISRTPALGDHRANLHAGAHGAPHSPTTEQQELAIGATRALGLNIAGVDIIQRDTHAEVLEVNSNPGFDIGATTGIDVISIIANHISHEANSKSF